MGYDFSGVVPPNEQIYFAGYPVDHEGELKLISSSGTRNSDIRELIHVPQNPLKSGSGGGPWLLRHTDENYQVIGVASHGKPARGIPGAFSPVLNAETAKLLQIAERTVETSSSEDTETVTSGPDVQLYTTS